MRWRKEVKVMNNWNNVVSDEQINKTVEALKANNINAVVVESANEAREYVLNLVPKKSEVMTMTSVTLDKVGLVEALNESGEYDSVKQKLSSLNRETDSRKMQQIGAAPEWAIGSVHAVTEDGKVVIASNSGSQLPGYAYGADNVVWVVGAQKLVSDLNSAMERLNEYVLPLESERARKAYGVEGSFVSKLLIFNREPRPNRITMVIVKESLGY